MFNILVLNILVINILVSIIEIESRIEFNIDLVIIKRLPLIIRN